MKPQSRLLCTVLSVAFCLSVGSQGCRPGEDEEASAAHGSPLAPYQAELLDIAFSAASAMPVDPHIKDRSRAQEAVVKAALALDQPDLALEYVEQIENWRRGTAYADLAWYAARQGATEQARSHLRRAANVAGTTEDWRVDRIRVQIAQVHAYLGDAETAAEFEQGAGQAEAGKVARVEAMRSAAGSFQEQMEDVAALVAKEQFDVVRNALDVYAELFRRFYEDPERRKRIKERVRESWDLMPLFIRVELLADLAEIAVAHEDQAETLALIDEARGIMESAQWPPYAEVTLVARLAALRFAAGDEQVAVQELERALVLFDAEKRRIVDIDRAETLRPIAEAYHRMGRDDAALEIYRRALEAGMENPNSRPRAEDLVDTCCSLAVHAVEPGRELMERIREVRDALGDPW